MFEKENEGTDFEEFILEQTGLKFKEIRHITLFGSFFPDEDPGRAADSDCRQGGQRQEIQGGEEIQGQGVGGRKGRQFHDQHKRLFWLLRDRRSTLVAGQVQSLKEVLRRTGPPEISKTLEAAIQEANFSNPIAAAFDLKDIRAEFTKLTRPRFGGGDRLSPQEKEERRFWDEQHKRFEADTANLFDWFDGAAIKVTLASRIEGKATLLFKAEHGRPLTASIELDTKTVVKLVQDGVEMGRAEQDRWKRQREFFDNNKGVKIGPP